MHNGKFNTFESVRLFWETETKKQALDKLNPTDKKARGKAHRLANINSGGKGGTPVKPTPKVTPVKPPPIPKAKGKKYVEPATARAFFDKTRKKSPNAEKGSFGAKAKEKLASAGMDSGIKAGKTVGKVGAVAAGAGLAGAGFVPALAIGGALGTKTGRRVVGGVAKAGVKLGTAATLAGGYAVGKTIGAAGRVVGGGLRGTGKALGGVARGAGSVVGGAARGVGKVAGAGIGGTARLGAAGVKGTARLGAAGIAAGGRVGAAGVRQAGKTARTGARLAAMPVGRAAQGVGQGFGTAMGATAGNVMNNRAARARFEGVIRKGTLLTESSTFPLTVRKTNR